MKLHDSGKVPLSDHLAIPIVVQLSCELTAGAELQKLITGWVVHNEDSTEGQLGDRNLLEVECAPLNCFKCESLWEGTRNLMHCVRRIIPSRKLVKKRLWDHWLWPRTYEICASQTLATWKGLVIPDTGPVYSEASPNHWIQQLNSYSTPTDKSLMSIPTCTIGLPFPSTRIESEPPPLVMVNSYRPIDPFNFYSYSTTHSNEMQFLLQEVLRVNILYFS